MVEPILKPCPLCGRQPVINSRGRAEGVVCTQRDHRIQTYGRDGSAIAAWNTRTPTADAGKGEDRDLQFRAIIAELLGYIKGIGGDPLNALCESSRRTLETLAPTAKMVAEGEGDHG